MTNNEARDRYFEEIENGWGVWTYDWGQKVYSHYCDNNNHNVSTEYTCYICGAAASQQVIDVWNLLGIRPR